MIYGAARIRRDPAGRIYNAARFFATGNLETRGSSVAHPRNFITLGIPRIFRHYVVYLLRQANLEFQANFDPPRRMRGSILSRILQHPRGAGWRREIIAVTTGAACRSG